jgi:hypothetical protein
MPFQVDQIPKYPNWLSVKETMMLLCYWGCGQEGVFRSGTVSRREQCEAWVCAKKAVLCPAKLSIMKTKRLATLSQVDEHGMSGFKRNALAVSAARFKEDGSFSGAEKMVKTKRSVKNEQGHDVYMQTAIKTATTRFGTYAGLKGKPEFKIYRYHVDRITKMQPLDTLPNYEKRAAYGRTDDPHQVDHRFSVVQGFLNHVPPYIIGHISNLEMLPSRANNSKGSSCSITKEALFEGFFSSIKAGR